MAPPRGRGLRPGGVVRALGRLILLVCVGFALGLIFGLVTEEPELLADHLSGESESVVLEAGAPENGIGSGARSAGPERAKGLVAESPARGEDPASVRGEVEDRATAYASAASDVRGLHEAESEPERGADLPAVASPPLSTGRAEVPVAAQIEIPESARLGSPREGDWSIQIGAFSDQAAAQQLAAGLRGRYPVVVLPARGEGGRWRVRVQPIEDEARARQTAEKLKRDEGLPTWVTRAEGRSGS